MPNRGPLELSLEEVSALLGELPSSSDLAEMKADAEDNEERLRVKHLGSAKERLEERQQSASGGAVVFSVDEVDELLDRLPPPSDASFTVLRAKLVKFRQDLD